MSAADNIISELNEFYRIWKATFTDPLTGKTRPAGGVGVTDGDGIQGVDYTDLIAWTKGNSVSTDQHTIHSYVETFDMLIRRRREHLQRLESGLPPRKVAGVTYRDFDKKGRLIALGGRGYSPGDRTKFGKEVEVLLTMLLDYELIQIFSEPEVLNKQAMETIRSEYRDSQRKCLLDDGFHKRRGVVNELTITAPNGHVGFSQDWEVLIRDTYGAPAGVPGAIPGSLTAHVPAGTPRTMPFEIHFAIGEVLAKFRKLDMGGELSPWGKNQLAVRKEHCDLAIEAGVDHISLNDYYRIFREHGVLHMADSELSKSAVNNSRPQYVLTEIPHSSPRQWNVELDPGLVRWRTVQRERAQEREGGSA